MTVTDVFKVLQARGGFEQVNHHESTGQLRIIGRVRKNSVPSWILVMNQLLAVSEQSKWTVDISKYFFRRDGKLLFGWRVIIQAANVAAFYPHVVHAISSAPRARAILEEQALPGSRGTNRNEPSHSNRGKGAHSVLRPVTGALALAALHRGG